jgi:Uma2 family endonuclease
MVMPSPQTDWTIEMVEALPDDGNRYEVIDGKLLVSPAPSTLHQRALLILYRLLWPYAEARGLEAFVAPVAVLFSSKHEVQPDLLVTPLVEGRPPNRVDGHSLALVVEILSPNARADRNQKRRLYQRERVPEYWIVDLEARLVERWRPGADAAEVLTTMLAWRPFSAEALVIDLTAYFRAVHRD